MKTGSTVTAVLMLGQTMEITKKYHFSSKSKERIQTHIKHTMKARDLKTFLFYFLKFVIYNYSSSSSSSFKLLSSVTKQTKANKARKCFLLSSNRAAVVVVPLSLKSLSLVSFVVIFRGHIPLKEKHIQHQVTHTNIEQTKKSDSLQYLFKMARRKTQTYSHKRNAT